MTTDERLLALEMHVWNQDIIIYLLTSLLKRGMSPALFEQAERDLQRLLGELHLCNGLPPDAFGHLDGWRRELGIADPIGVPPSCTPPDKVH